MPWLSEDLRWEVQTDETKEIERPDEDEPWPLRVLAESLGLRFPDSEDPEYFE